MKSLIEKAKRFQESQSNSLAFKLMIPETFSHQVIHGQGVGYLCSIAFRAWDEGFLSDLDHMFSRWEIDLKATDDFKGRLAETWLGLAECDSQRIRKAAHSTLSAISELSVASYLDSKRYNVTNLTAWDSNSPDVLVSENGHNRHVEVKYLSATPEELDMNIKGAREGVACGWIPNEGSCLNYYYYRLAQAQIQLSRKSQNNGTWIFIVFDRCAEKENVNRFSSSTSVLKEWYRSTKGTYEGILEEDRSEVLSKQPFEWINLIERLTVGILNDNFSIKVTKEVYNISNNS